MASTHTLFVGCSTGKVVSLSFSPANSSLNITHSTDKAGKNPGWLVLHPTSERVLLAATEEEDGGKVAAFEIAHSNELRHLKTCDAGGAGTVTVDIARNARYAAVANYSGASIATLTLLPNGIPWPHSILATSFTLEQPGPVTERQSACFPHQALYDPTGEFLFVADLGADVVRIYSSAPNSGTGALEPVQTIELEKGSGPRHMAFYQPSGSPKGSRATHLYVINELSNTVAVFTLSYSEDGKVIAALVQTVSTILDKPPEGYQGFASELAVHAEHGLLFAGNRWRKDGQVADAQDDVTVYAIDDTARTLSPLRSHSLSCLNAKHFELAPSGEWLAVASKGSGALIIFSVQGWKELARMECEGASVVRWWPR